MSSLLVSLCNLPEPGGTAVLRLDTKSWSIFPVPLKSNKLIKTCTGMTRDGDLVYVLCADTDGNFYLAGLGFEGLETKFFQPLPEIVDGHSILVHHDRLCIASTGNDRVICYTLSDDGVGAHEVIWSVPGSQTDTHHVNSLALWKGDLVLSAFGPKSGQTWSTAADGYIFNVTKGVMLIGSIYQPHSLKEWGGDLYFCESARGKVGSLGGVALEIGNYTRGLDFLGSNVLALGSSMARKVSKSTGLINNPADPGKQSGGCEVSVFNLSSLSDATKEKSISLGEFAPEIYDLLYLGDASPSENSLKAAHLGEQRNDQAIVVAQLRKELLDQHQALSEACHSLESSAREVDAISNRLKTSENEVVLLQEIIAGKDEELQKLRQQFEEQNTELERQQKVLELTSRQLEQTRDLLNVETAESNGLREKNLQQRVMLEELHGSRSWRYTAPIRWLSKHLRMLR